MKNLSRPIINAIFIVFIIGIFISLYHVFFEMPEAVLKRIGISNTDHTKLDIAKYATVPTLVIISVELLLGLLLIIILLANNRKFIGTENIVYVTNTFDDKQDKTQTDNTQQAHNLAAQIKNIQLKIEAIAETKAKLQEGLNQLCDELDAGIGVLFVSKEINGRKYIEFLTGYAYLLPDSQTLTYEYGEGISGQVAKTEKEIIISKVPDGYITITSGLGKATPSYMISLPLFNEGILVGVIEIAAFSTFSNTQIDLAREIANYLGKYIQKEFKGVVLSKN